MSGETGRKEAKRIEEWNGIIEKLQKNTCKGKKRRRCAKQRQRQRQRGDTIEKRITMPIDYMQRRFK